MPWDVLCEIVPGTLKVFLERDEKTLKVSCKGSRAAFVLMLSELLSLYLADSTTLRWELRITKTSARSGSRGGLMLASVFRRFRSEAMRFLSVRDKDAAYVPIHKRLARAHEARNKARSATVQVPARKRVGVASRNRRMA